MHFASSNDDVTEYKIVPINKSIEHFQTKKRILIFRKEKIVRPSSTKKRGKGRKDREREKNGVKEPFTVDGERHLYYFFLSFRYLHFTFKCTTLARLVPPPLSSAFLFSFSSSFFFHLKTNKNKDNLFN